jgi:predicted O-methyltransferase YrrM
MVLLDQRLHPDEPWLTRHSVKLLAQLLRSEDVALEFGSGRSTCWFARRISKVTSVEHHAVWHQIGLQRLRQEGMSNVDLLLRPLDVPESEGDRSAYVHVLDEVSDASIDICLVDGVYRGFCALGAISKIKSGGFIVVDNAGWFLPSNSRTPGARPLGTGCYDRAWADFAKQTSRWRWIWTTDGVNDTVFLFKTSKSPRSS